MILFMLGYYFAIKVDFSKVKVAPNLNTPTYLLKRSLLSGYDQYIRPVKNENTISVIQIDLTLFQVVLMVWIFSE